MSSLLPKINLDGDFSSGDFLGEALLTLTIKLDSSKRKEVEPIVNDEWVGY